jgi:hypothetical protein
LLATACGYSYPIIDAMTLFEFEELANYWAKHPPLHLLVGAYLGVGKGKRSPTVPGARAADRDPALDLGSVLARLGPGFDTGDVHAGLAPAVLDFVELHRQATISASGAQGFGH